MTDPFKLLRALLVAFFKIAGYALTCGLQAFWCVLHGRSDLVHDAVGALGRGVTDAIADVFKS